MTRRRKPARRAPEAPPAAERAVALEPSPEPAPVASDAPRPKRRRGPARAEAGSPVLRSLWSGTKLVSGVLIVICASVAVAWGAHRYALTTPRFAMRTLEVEGNRRKTDAQIAALAGVHAGQNLFALSLANAERAVCQSGHSAVAFGQQVRLDQHVSSSYAGTSIMAFTRFRWPDSSENRPTTSSRPIRCVIQASVSSRPSSISLMIRRNVAGIALRLPINVSSRLWKSRSLKVTSP